MHRRSRRSVLLSGGTVTAAGLAGCGGDGAPDGDPAASTDPATETTAVSDLVGDGEANDGPALQDALEAAAEEPGGTLEIPEGVYRIEPVDRAPGAGYMGGPNHQGFHLHGKGLEDVDVVGPEAELVFTDPTRAGLLLEDGEGVRLSGLSVDWDPLPWSQGTITAVDDGGSEFEVRIAPGHLPLDAETFEEHVATVLAYVFDEHSNLLVSGRQSKTAKPVAEIERQDGHRFRVSLRDGTSPDGIDTDRRVALVTRRPTQALTVRGVTEPVLEDLTIYTSTGNGVRFGDRTDRPVVRRVTMQPRPDEDRLISTCADGVMVEMTDRGPIVEDCHFEGVMDDVIAMPVFGRQVFGREDDETLIVRTVQNAVVDAGDTLEAITVEGERQGSLPPVGSVEAAGEASYRDETRSAERIAFESPVPDVEPGMLLLNRDTAHEGFEIRNNTMRNCRAKGVKAHGRDGLIADNEIDGTTGAGIEAGIKIPGRGGRGQLIVMWVEDLTIRENTIRRAGLYGFPYGSMDHPRGLSTGIKIWGTYETEVDGPVNENVQLSDNTIVRPGQAGIRAEITENLTVEDNTIRSPNVLGFEEDYLGVHLVDVHGASVTGNAVWDTTGDVETVLRTDDRCRDIEASDNQLRRE
jgi:hypothetical protein